MQMRQMSHAQMQITLATCGGLIIFELFMGQES